MARDGHAAELPGVLELAMASSRRYQEPSIFFDELDDLADLHRGSDGSRSATILTLSA